RVYPVADLVVPIPGLPNPVVGPENKATLEDALMRLLVQTIQPGGWQCNGGRGLVEYAPLGMALGVSPTPDVHEPICDLLAARRRLREVRVALEVRTAPVSEAGLERIGHDGAECRRGTDCLDNKQVASLLEAVQGDRRANIMQAPKMTLLSGQTGSMKTDSFR